MDQTFHSRTTTRACVSKSNIRPSESVIAANVPLGDKVNFSPFLGGSFKQVREAAVTQHSNKSAQTIQICNMQLDGWSIERWSQ